MIEKTIVASPWTSVGAYPFEAVRIMDRVAWEVGDHAARTPTAEEREKPAEGISERGGSWGVPDC